jgi:membrane protein
MSRTHPYFRMAKEFVMLIISQYREKGCQKSAASLTYVTLFAIVPLMTVTYSMFSVIPAFQGLGDQMQQLIFAHALPETGQELVTYLQEFSKQARNLTAVGVIFLVISAYLMLTDIEKNFNAVWGGLSERKGVANFLLYWAVLSLGPLLLGVGLVMSTYLASLRLFMNAHDALGILALVFEIAPFLLTTAAFTLLFVAVPNCKVPLVHGFIGGLATTLVFVIFKALFSWVVSKSSFTLIYGAFAIVPLFLLWINLIWTVILGGAVLVRTISIYQIGLKDRRYPDLLATLLVLWCFHQASVKGRSVNESSLINIGLSTEQWQRIRAALQKHQVIAVTHQDEFVLSKDLRYLTLAQLADMLSLPRQLPEDRSKLQELPWFATIVRHLGEVDKAVNEQFSVTLAQLFQPAAQPQATAETKLPR